MSAKIFILILNYRRHQDTAECIKALQKSDLLKNSEIVIIDNTQDNSSKDFFLEKFPKLKLLKNTKNLGFAGGNNIGIKYALKNKATHVLVINPDVKVPKDFFKPLLKIFTQKPKMGLIAPALKHQVKGKTYYGLDGYLDWSKAKPGHHSVSHITNKALIKAEFLTFACVLIKSEVFVRAGLLDKRYFMYLEDVDFCITAGKKGYDLYLDPSVVATHQTSASFSHPRQKLKISFISHLKFVNKWIPFPQKIFALGYQLILYPYLYLLWSYQYWKYSN